MTHPDRFLLAGVMGWPVTHSRSPMLHNYWFRQHGLAGTYVPLAIRPEHLAAALRGLHPLGFAGVNVTIPHKQEAMKVVNEVDALARSIGAISCVIVKPDGSLAGTNNDCYGFIHAIRQEQPGWRADAGPITVIGAGGGARAVCYGLAREGAKEIRLLNRTFARSPPTSSTSRSKRRSSPRRASAATAPSTAWACCSIRAGRRGRRGSVSSPR